jgi:cytochrome P450
MSRRRVPCFFSIFRDVLRFNGRGVSARMLMGDFVLDDTFLLKKGGIILIPSTVQHRLQSSWGENGDQFHHKRFIRRPGDKGKGHIAVSFCGFGGRSIICLGRHFAATKILAFAALTIMRFNVGTLQGEWKMPTVDNTNIAPFYPDTGS